VLFRLLLLFIMVPLAELALLIEVGKRIDVGPTLGLIVVTGLVGAWLARREGLRTLTRIRTDLAAGRLPADQLIDALLILIAGALLVTPGIMTDVVGFLLLIPPVRGGLRNHLKTRFRAKFTVMDLTDLRPPCRDDLIDVEARGPEEE